MMVRFLFFMALAAPALAHQVPVMTCDLTATETATKSQLVLGYDEHDVTFPMQLDKGPVIKLKGGRVDGGEAFSGQSPDGPVTLEIPKDAPALLILGETRYEGTCRR